MKLADAKLCPEGDCNEIYTEDFCPVCTSTQYLLLAALIDPAARKLRELLRKTEIINQQQKEKRA